MSSTFLFFFFSPVVKFLCGVSHFCLSWRSGKYSLVHLVQNRLAIYCICLHRRRAYWSSLSKTPGGMLGCVFISNRWLGVKASTSLRSSEDWVIGLLFMMASTSHMTVWSPSSSSVCCCNTELNTFLIVRICLSHTPPWCEAAGVLKIHLIPFSVMVFCIFVWSKFSNAFRSSFSAATKFVPLSERNIFTCPLLHINLRMALMQESVSRLWAISMCTALTVRHVKITPYRLMRLLPRLISKGPKKSTPTLVKGGWSGCSLSSGRSAIFCLPALALSLLHTVHFEIILLTAALAWGIQYFSRSTANI